ncbi:hypothetical protein Sjap_024109 [Stephania japonica]|uniref:Uncharacterized protein n=1 Tax=Stephania japonica TaxID=461633 RepID=A0AAP0EHL3_9MAGN
MTWGTAGDLTMSVMESHSPGASISMMMSRNGGDMRELFILHRGNATTVEDEDDIAKFKDYKPSQLGDSKEAKVPSDPSPPTPPKKEDTEPVSSAEPKKPKFANAPQSRSRIFASPLARKLANNHKTEFCNIFPYAVY